MALLETQTITAAGAALSTVSASSDGDEAPVGGDRMLYIEVDSGASESREVTVTAQATVDGLDVDDLVVTVDAGDTQLVRLTDVFRNPDTARAAISYDDNTDVSVAVLQAGS